MRIAKSWVKTHKNRDVGFRRVLSKALVFDASRKLVANKEPIDKRACPANPAGAQGRIRGNDGGTNAVMKPSRFVDRRVVLPVRPNHKVHFGCNASLANSLRNSEVLRGKNFFKNLVGSNQEKRVKPRHFNNASDSAPSKDGRGLRVQSRVAEAKRRASKYGDSSPGIASPHSW